MTEYTPDTEEVRELYWAVSGDPRRDSKAWAEFDRWLQKVKAEAWDEGYWRGINGHTGPGNPYRESEDVGRNWPVDDEGNCETCRGSGQVAVGPWGVRPPKVKCPDCDGKWTRD